MPKTMNSHLLLRWSLLLWTCTIRPGLFSSSNNNKVIAAAEAQDAQTEHPRQEDRFFASKKEDVNEEEVELEEEEEVDYLIIGGGGSGIQMALYLQKYGYSYTILEKENVPGSFWNRFPRFGELISVNKWTRKKKHALRYDWHSFLEAPLTMFNITESYWPTGGDWQTYMSEVVRLANLTIEYGAEVDRVVTYEDESCTSSDRDGDDDKGTTKKKKPYVVMADGTKRCAKRRIFVGTGLVEKKEPLLEAVGAIPYSRITRETARRKRVCIFGNGNAGFETAQNVYDVADRVSVYGKTPLRVAAVTKSSGDVRTKFLQVLENFHFKLRDSVDQADSWYPPVGGDKETEAAQYHERQLYDLRCRLDKADRLKADHAADAYYILKRDDCEVSVIATGFRSHVPGRNLTSRFPSTNDWYESTDSPRVHYIGWLMHERDFRRSASGFLAGYRYLIRNLVHHVCEQDNGIPYPCLTLTKEQVIRHVNHRLDVTSDLIILQDGLVLRDAIVLSTEVEGQYHYYEGANYHYHQEIMAGRDVIFLYFVWGDTRRAQDIFENMNRYTDSRNLRNLHIHPVLEVNGMVFEFPESIRVEWSSSLRVEEVEKLMWAVFEGNMEEFKSKPPNFVATYARTVVNQYDDHDEEVGQELDDICNQTPENAIYSAIYRSILSNYSHDDLKQLDEAFLSLS